MDRVEKYNLLIHGFKSKPVTPTAYSPLKRDLDYQRGYVTRYFCQKSTDLSSPIFEISSTSFLSMSSNPYFSVAKLKWRITGPIDQVDDDTGKLVDMGVLKSNENSIKLSDEKIPSLNLYLPNLKQFHK